MTSLPTWVSDSFSDSLKKYLNNKAVKIVDHKSFLALPVGSNYTTDIFRTVITYENSKNQTKAKISVIIKVCPNNQVLIEYDKLSKLSDQEITVYTEVLPAIHKILDGAITLTPRCISFIKEPRPAIILEDLSVEEFKMHPRQHGLDLDHCILALKTLAHFHAASAVLYEKHAAMINRYNLGIFWNNPFTLRWLDVGFDALAEACSRWPGFEKYGKMLKISKCKAIEKTLAAVKLNSDDFSILNHGDFWINNAMFTYAGGKLKDCRIIDFQVVLHSSPAIDLNFFWATSPNTEVRAHHLNTLLKHYYKQLTFILSKLRYPQEKVPTFELFQNDFKQRAFYGLTSSVTVLPFVRASNRSDASFEELLSNGSEDGFRYDSFNNERYRECMEYLLPYYDNLGVFNM